MSVAEATTTTPMTFGVRARLLSTLTAFGLLTLVTCVLAPLVGSTPISLARALDRSIPFAQNVDAQIFFVARLPRVLAGAIVGASLASAGVVLQALLRNPLADPFTLGVSAGASVGAMVAIVFASALAFAPVAPVPIASLAGALLAAVVVYRLATATRRAMSPSVLLLAGVTLNAFFSAVIMFMQYIADFADVYRAARWLMGDLDVGGFAPLIAVSPLVIVSAAMLALLPASLNLLSVGPDAAAARGVDVKRVHRLAFISSSIATSASVSLAGPIGFVGIIVPHIVRLAVGVDHRLVLPASALFGAAFLVGCDLAARTVFAPIELPVGIVTAIVGGPFFLWLLVRKG